MRPLGRRLWLRPTGSSFFRDTSRTSNRGTNTSIRFFLAHVLNSPEQYRYACEVARGAAQPTVTLSELKRYTVPVPPLAEQQEIVRRVDALFALADRIEAKLAAARKRVDALTQAVLAKAFRGELVPTEAELARREKRTYESAAELLARIRTEREAASASDQPRRRKRPK